MRALGAAERAALEGVPVQCEIPADMGSLSKPAAEFQILLAGDSGVGKTSFVKSYLTGEFQSRHYPTMGADFQELRLRTNCGEIAFSVMEVGSRLVGGSHHLRGRGQAAIVIFDVTSKATYQRGLEIISALETIPTVLIGNKIDLPQELREVKAQQVRSHCGAHVQFYGMSVFTRHNIEKPLLWLARRLANQPSLQLVGNYAAYPPTCALSVPSIDLERLQHESWLIRIQSARALQHEQLPVERQDHPIHDEADELSSDAPDSPLVELSSESSSDCRARNLSLRNVQQYVEKVTCECSSNASLFEGSPSFQEADARLDVGDKACDETRQNLDGVWLSSEGEPVAVIRGVDVWLLGDAEGLKTSISELGTGIWSIVIADEEFFGDCHESEGGELVFRWSDGETWKRQEDASTDVFDSTSCGSGQVTRASETEKQDTSTDAFDSSFASSACTIPVQPSSNEKQNVFADKDEKNDFFADFFDASSTSSMTSSAESDSSDSSTDS
mmetsp:Transcript_65291/g.120358  ORF Transcript_65291/g.120358 Transcript_65291/m.120358 type:complete len:501 (-) Transcript_65291:65-1567(-)